MTDEATNDKTDGDLCDPLPALDPDLRGYLSRYRSKLLNEPQRLAYLDDLKRMVAAVPPRNRFDAQQMLSTACRFIVDRNPAEGTPLSVLFTEAQVAIWMNDQARRGKGGRTPDTARGRLRRLVRVAVGQPGRNDRVAHPVVLPKPWSNGVLAAVTAALGTAEPAAVRGFVAGVGAALVGAPAVGLTIEVSGPSVTLLAEDGTRHRVCPQLASLAALVDGQVVAEGDWRAACDAAAGEGIRLDPHVAHQTFRRLVFSFDEPVAQLIRSFRLGYKAIDHAIAAVRRNPSVDSDLAAFGVLRGGGCANSDDPGTVEVNPNGASPEEKP